ncbi:MAG: DUF3152 domain-containing protein [Nitriliruptorales bacterium]|nr:DUF3152 domain-containing protein [Nitriliruptorales bacterium]
MTISTAAALLASAVVACTAAPTPAPSPPSKAQPEPSPTTTAGDSGIDETIVRVRIERLTRDAATAGFETTVMDVLTDPRGWRRAGFMFVSDDHARYQIVLGEGRQVDRLCRPYDTRERFSCQNGPAVALNAERWRTATSTWPAGLEAYRVMLVNHEVGHLLHLHHPQPQCPGRGLPAPVMAQQSTTLGGCQPNPWPLQWEVHLASRRAESLAPPARHDPADHRPSPPPVRGG